MISVEQIRAARAMLDWTQEILARECGLSLATIHNLEKGHLSLRSCLDVKRTLEGYGFEFFGANGLVRRTDEQRMFEGESAPQDFFDDILATVKEKGGTLTGIFKMPENFVAALGGREHHDAKQIEQIIQYARIKCLFSEMHKSSLQLRGIQAKAVSQFLPDVWSTLTYGDKYCVILSKNQKDFTYFVTKSCEIVGADNLEFESRWTTAIPIPVN